MFNIHEAHDMERVLPEHLERLLSERDQLLNRLNADQLLEIYDANESRLIVDRGMALNAAISGVPVSGLASTFALLFPALIIATPVLFFFVGWEVGALSLLTAIVSFKASRHFAKEDVGRAALKNPKLLHLLMQKGVVWFEMADR